MLGLNSIVAPLIFVICFILILFVLFTKKLKAVGVKTKDSEKKIYRAYFKYYLDWFKKYWFISLIIVIFAVAFYLGLLQIKSKWDFFGIIFIPAGLFMLISNYKKFAYVTDTPTYRMFKAQGRENVARVFYYIIGLIVIIAGFAFLLLF